MKFLCVIGRIESLPQTDGLYAWQPRIVNTRRHKLIDWDQESVVLVTISTAGDGETQDLLAYLLT